MKTLVIINSLINLIIVINWIKNQNYYYFEIDRTFWKKKPYAISLCKITSGNKKEGSYSASTVFSIPLPGGKKALA